MEQWIRSSFCAADKPQCVEVRDTPRGVELRDSKLGDDSPVLLYTHEEWEAFTAGVRAGEFDPKLVTV
jgi:hypothetical protein